MNKILNFGLTSIAIPLLVTLITLWINKYIEKKEKKKILKTNFIILIKDVQDLLLYLESIIKNREILEKHFIQKLDYNQILIDYNSIIDNDRKVINNLLEFYNLRTKIKKYLLDEKIEIPDYLDKKMGVYKKNVWLELSHISFIESIYKDLDNIFIKNNLEKELKKWDENFTFKSLKEIKRDRKQMLLTRKKELENDLKRIMNENNVDLTKKDLEIDEQELLHELHILKGAYNSQKSAENYYSKNEFNSLQEVYYQIYYQYKEIYDIKAEIE